MRPTFDQFAASCARFTGRPAMLLIAAIVVAIAGVAWIHNDDHLMWGAGLTLSGLSLLLLPILQATQNRDDAALHAKLDELIKSNANARNALIGLENESQDVIEEVRAVEEESGRPTQ